MRTIISPKDYGHQRMFIAQRYFPKNKMKNILVPCDFSKHAVEAFKFAVSIAQQSNGKIHVLYVVDITFLKGNPTISHTYAFNINFLKEIEKEAEEQFAAIRRKYAPERMNVVFKHSINSLLPEIETYSTANRIDLIVMGTHGFMEASHTANTKRALRNVKVPVLSVHTAPGEGIKHIVVPIWPDQNPGQFIHEVKKLQDFFDARIHLLRVNTPLLFKNDEDATRELQQFAGEYFSNATLNIRSDLSIEEGIIHFAKETKADMIALGTHGRTGFVHFLTGSVAENIIEDVEIPVWIYRLG